MRHYILTRSAFAPSVAPEENRRRLALLAGVTVPSLRAQTNRDLTWIVLIDPTDPNLDERVAAIESAGLPTLIRPAGRMELRKGPDRPQSAAWGEAIAWRRGPVLTTRLDDDDAFVPEALAWVRAAAEGVGRMRQVVLTFPSGWRLAGQLVERVTYKVPMFSSLLTQRRSTINDVCHLAAARLGRMAAVTNEPAWLWVRHDMTRSHPNMRRSPNTSGHRLGPVTDELRARFPIDWPLVESLPQRGPIAPDRVA